MPRDLPAVPTSVLIAAASDRLTPTERRIAEIVTAEPTLLAFGTVTDLARRVGTSRPSIVRFAHKLGFDGYTHLQESVRRGLSQQLFRPSDRIRLEDSSASPARRALAEAISGVFDVIDDDRLATLAAPITQAETVWIISGETSRAGAHALASGLAILRPSVHLIRDHSTGVDFAGTGPQDCAVIFDFFRYKRQTLRTAHLLVDLAVQIVAITDSPLSPLAALTPTWCGLQVPAVGPMDSSIPAVAVAELIVAQVAHTLHDDATDRIDIIEELWEKTETFLPDTE